MARERSKKGALPPSQETIDKLDKTVSDGNYYGAQQMYKTMTARYVSAERYAEALDILESGACVQLKHGQVTCGAELAVLFVENLVKRKVPYNEETLGEIYIRPCQENIPGISSDFCASSLGEEDDVQKLTEALGAAKIRVDGCSSFLKAAIRWSAQFGGPKDGSPELHTMLAEYIYSESPELDMAKVSVHFVRGNDPKKFASTLVNFMGKCYPGEDDVAIARAILLYLSLMNLRDANCLLDELRKQVGSMQLELPRSDLIQFVIYLLQTLERDALPLFRMLRQNYKSSIDREPAFNEVSFTFSYLLLDEISEKFYGVQRKNPLQGMFGDIFKMMGGGDLSV
ncbi:hypothetical protein IFM89_010270 [Coptis chinensis]|uniref:Golgi to ER traffic protein 4 homolog n=1 Tax=Coptis chinensis TaxID=261450 RepID=A0A835H572_9MAGN|nr:hypothetical protein IFM89_010270 [Coptis chinensis]